MKKRTFVKEEKLKILEEEAFYKEESKADLHLSLSELIEQIKQT